MPKRCWLIRPVPTCSAASELINRLMVNPMPHSIDTPYSCNQLTPSGRRPIRSTLASQAKPNTPICLPMNSPVTMPSEFDQGLKSRKAIYTPFPQAVPKKFVIDKVEERPCHLACRDACPLHMNVPGYLKLVAEGQIDEAYRLIRATNPLPGICGRVCYAPCQDACNRGQIDESLGRFFTLRRGDTSIKPSINVPIPKCF